MLLLAHLRQWFSSLRRLTFRHLLRLPSVLSLRERLALAGGLLAIVGGTALLITSWVLRATEVRPAVGGTYVEGLVGEPRLVNPLFAPANEVDRDLIRLLFAGILRTDANGAFIPDLAERVETSTDAKVTTVTLRHDVRWHDGARITADDIVFTFRLIEDPRTASPLRGITRGVTVARVDDRTVRFTLERPSATFASALTIGLLPAHLWSDIPPAHLTLADVNLRPIGSGPYRFAGLTKEKSGAIRTYTVERFEGFHRTPALLARITFRFAPDHAQLLAALEHREVDGIGTLMPLGPRAIARSDVTPYEVRLPETTAVFLNPRRDSALRDLAVRQALDRAVDRRAIVTEVLGGSGEPIGGPRIVGFSPIADPPTPTAFDPSAAMDLLDRAKWARVDRDAYITARTRTEIATLMEERRRAATTTAPRRPRRPITVPPPTEEERRVIDERIRREVDADCPGCAAMPTFRLSPPRGPANGRGGEPLALVITTPEVPELVAIAERLRDGWRAIGIRATVAVVPLERIRSEIIPQRAYDALLFSQILGPEPDPFPFWHSSQVRHPGLNLTFFSNRTIDKLLEEARVTTDRAVRAQKYAAFQQLLAEERPAIFLTAPTRTYPVAQAVRGIRLGTLTQPADRFTTITEWYTTTRRRWRRP